MRDRGVRVALPRSFSGEKRAPRLPVELLIPQHEKIKPFGSADVGRLGVKE